jgi:acetyl-CoA carboxylase, biotin carboxyl carrier protein
MTSPKKSADNAQQTELVENLADIAKRLDLSEIEYETGDLKIRVARQMTTATYHMPVAVAEPPRAAVAAPVGAPAAAVEHPGTVKSPMVGTAYLRPAPESSPFVDIGSTVKAGDKILLVEAMKTFNEIIAPKAGTVTQILVSDGEPVEYGQSLFVIE